METKEATERWDHYQEMTFTVPMEQWHESDFDIVSNLLHDYYKAIAVRNGKQLDTDCGDPESPGCFGCNVMASTIVVDLGDYP